MWEIWLANVNMLLHSFCWEVMPQKDFWALLILCPIPWWSTRTRSRCSICDWLQVVMISYSFLDFLAVVPLYWALLFRGCIDLIIQYVMNFCLIVSKINIELVVHSIHTLAYWTNCGFSFFLVKDKLWWIAQHPLRESFMRRFTRKHFSLANQVRLTQGNGKFARLVNLYTKLVLM